MGKSSTVTRINRIRMETRIEAHQVIPSAVEQELIRLFGSLMLNGFKSMMC